MQINMKTSRFSCKCGKLSVALQGKTKTFGKSMSFTEQANNIFRQAISDYHLTDNVDTPVKNPYQRDSKEYSL